MDFETKIKQLAMKLSSATKASDLSAMLSFSVKMQRFDIAHKTVKLMTPQRLGEMTDQELSEVVTSLVLLPIEDKEAGEDDVTDIKALTQFWKVLEYLILRRIHQLSATELSKITQAYSHLIAQGKMPESALAQGQGGGSISFIKTLEY